MDTRKKTGSKKKSSSELSSKILLAEYHALYRLAEFRMISLDRRVPLTGAALVTFLGGVPMLDGQSGIILLIFIPASLIWFVRTTINHARSFEDVLRRIEWIEGQLNRLVGKSLLGFQSTHPSRGKTTGGRTGFETIEAVGLASALLIASCAFLANSAIQLKVQAFLAYDVYLVLIACHTLQHMQQARRYRYQAADSQKTEEQTAPCPTVKVDSKD